MKILVIRTALMKHYREHEPNTRFGGRYVEQHGYGHEMYNFLPYRGVLYGYGAHPPHWTTKIERLGASPQDEYIDGVLVVWVAGRPGGGVFVYGWYKNARVYRNYQDGRDISNRKYKKEYCSYNVQAKAADGYLIAGIRNRNIEVPIGKGGLGQSNIWFPDPVNQTRLLTKLNQFELTKKHRPKNAIAKSPRQLDVEKRLLIERKSVDLVWDHLEDEGFDVESVERDAVGWDLTASQKVELLRVEVKGLSGPSISVELTPNEFAAMEKYKKSYVLCIVTETLTKRPLLHTFSFDAKSSKWVDANGRRLELEKLTGARLSC